MTNTQPCPTLIRSSIPHGDWTECCLTSRDNAPLEAANEVADKEAVTVVRQDVFQCGGAEPAWQPTTGWPVTHLMGINGGGPGLGGTHLMGIANRQLKPVEVNGRLLGFYTEDAYARYCWLTGIRPSDVSLSAPEQTQSVFEAMEAALAVAGMTFNNVVRTWFFNHRILDWYDDFNVVRTRFFKKCGVFDGVVPASTGVGMPNAHGGKLITDVFAILPKDDSIQIQAVPSPLQCPALDYGSSFSRALEINTPSHRRLMISGTASIALDGKTAHEGDIDAQIALTMDVLDAILESRGLSWSDAYRSIAYVKRAGDAPVFEAYCRDHNLPDLYHVCTEADVCRDDLLFELEIEAVKPAG